MAGRLSPIARAQRALGLKATFVLLVLIFWLSAKSAQLFASLTTPPRVRLTGALFPAEEENREGPQHNLTVFIGEKRWTFRLEKAEVVAGTGRNRVILQRLFPPVVRFIGPEDLIYLLQKEEIATKLLTIEGLLYTGSRTLFIIAVDEAE